MPTVITEGAMAARGFGFGASSAAANYIEDVFSTYLYTGNGSTQTITNGINLSGKGGLVWTKNRSNAYSHYLIDSARGSNYLSSNTTSAQATSGSDMVFGTTGYTVGNTTVPLNSSGQTVVGWTFRKQAKFFDIVTYTGTGSNRTIAHNLGSTPGCIMVKRTDTTGNWQVYHSGLTSAAYSIQLNSTAAQASATTVWNSTAPTSSVFSVGTDASVNASGGTYVAYIYASNAGGFGAAGTDNVITCGSFTTDGSGNATVTLGYEAQWVLVKSTNNAGNNWVIMDNMRGWPNTGSMTGVNTLYANTAAGEASGSGGDANCPTSTGFQFNAAFGGPAAASDNIYIAIRRGPMKTPTDAATVFQPVVRTGTGAVVTVSTTVTPDFYLCKDLASAYGVNFFDRLRGASATSTPMLNTPSSGAETTPANTVNAFQNISVILGTNGNNNYSGYSFGNFFFSRAPGFFDEVCWTTTGSVVTQSHNLGVTPEIVIVKSRSNSSLWTVNFNFSSTACNEIDLNLTNAGANYAYSAGTSVAAQPTSTQIQFYQFSSPKTYIAYLFASCPGVSKVGSYSGTGATQTINCGFTGGARFVLIKRTDSAGDWYMFDSANGFTSSSSPYILLSSVAAQTTGNNGCYAASTGFTTTSTANATVNVNGAAYIFLAIA
jgi:hypothetical protein